MDQDTTWYGGMPRPMQETVLDGDPAHPTERGTAAPTFRPMSIVAKRLPISVTVELLFPMIDACHNPHSGVLVWHNLYQLFTNVSNRMTQ